MLPLEVDPTLNTHLVMATLVLAVGTLLLVFFQGLSRLESGSLPGRLGIPSGRLELATVPVRSSPAVDALGAEVPEAFLRLPRPTIVFVINRVCRLIVNRKGME